MLAAKCPTCGSPTPEQHPTSPITHEIRICADAFHDTSAARAALNEAVGKAAAILREALPSSRFAIYVEHESLSGGAANFVPTQPILHAWAGTFDRDAYDGKLGPRLKAMADEWLKAHQEPMIKLHS